MAEPAGDLPPLSPAPEPPATEPPVEPVSGPAAEPVVEPNQVFFCISALWCVFWFASCTSLLS